MQHYLLQIAATHEHSLGAVRCHPGVMAAVENDIIWLQCIPETAALLLKKLPVTNTYLLQNENQLFLPGALTPVTLLPQLQWQPLNTLIKPEIPVSAMPAILPEPAPFRLKKAATAREGAAIHTTLETWKSYAESVQGIRLQQLHFAASARGNVLIMGQPLPALPGTEYWQYNNLLLPAGYEVQHPTAATVLGQLYNANGAAWLLVNTQGQVQIIDKNFFVKASRSAVRLTIPVK